MLRHSVKLKDDGCNISFFIQILTAWMERHFFNSVNTENALQLKYHNLTIFVLEIFFLLYNFYKNNFIGINRFLTYQLSQHRL